MKREVADQSSIPFLAVPLPEDILKLKWCGEFEQAERIIDRRLEKELPQALRERLILEKEILKRIPEQYPYTWEGALERMREHIRDFQEEELQDLWEEDAADWIFIKGQVHFRENFLENIVKTRQEYEARVIQPSLWGDGGKAELLDRTIQAMKAEGGQAWRFHMKITIALKGQGERDGAPVRVWLPLPVEYAQIKNVRLLAVRIGGREADPAEYKVAPPESAQRTVCIEAVHRVGQTYQIEFAFENHGTYVDLDAEEAIAAAGEAVWKMRREAAEKTDCGAAGDAACDTVEATAREAGTISASLNGSTDDPSRYLDEQLPHIRFTPYIRALAEEIIGDEQNPLRKARKIYGFITSRVMYSYVRSYLTLSDIPESAAVSLKGDCGVQALLFITLCRAAGIPARWQAGLYTAPEDIGNHDWAQFYVEPFGWRFADCSFGGSAYRKGSSLRRDFYFGNLDPFRLPAAREFQADFSPSFKHLRNDPYDNQEGEAEYEDAGLRADEYETQFEMVKAELLH